MSSSNLGVQFQGVSGLVQYWTNIPSMIMGINGGGALSTTTGVPLGTPSEEILAKIGGGVKKADNVSDQLPASTSGMSQGGTVPS
jgi:NADH:ubiquinone oxidoreductase subunit F (NADH-binding)